MPRAEPIKHCAICGCELGRGEYVRVTIQHVKPCRKRNYLTESAHFIRPMLKVCMKCNNKAVAAYRNLEVNHG